MEAPEKIYIEVTPDGTRYYRDVVKEQRTENSDIEYIRKDTFIEKACEWLKNNVEKYYYLDEVYDKVISVKNLNNDFKKYFVNK